MAEGGRCVFNDIVVEPLTKENSAAWFNWVRNYLIARDLWEVIEENNKQDFVSWRRKNAAVLHIIQTSCNPQSLSPIVEVSEAKAAWDILTNIYNYAPPQPELELKPEPEPEPEPESEPEPDPELEPEPEPEPESPPQVIEDGVHLFYKAICDDNLYAIREMIRERPPLLSAKLTPSGQTALHVAALFRHLAIVEELLILAPPEYLEIVDVYGNTPLIIAIVTGVIQIARCMVQKNTTILAIATPTFELPVSLAFRYGHKEMGRFLYHVTPLEFLLPESGSHGPGLLRCCLLTQDLDIVLDALQRCPFLLFASDPDGWRPILGIAAMSSAFRIRSELGFWKQCNYNWVSLLRRIFNFLGMEQTHGEPQLVHEQKAEILNLVCQNVKTSMIDANVIADAMFRAAKEGNVEFVVQVSKANPEILLIPEKATRRNIFFYAVLYRQAGVFNLIHGLRFKESLASDIDKDGNTLLHVAAMLAPASQLDRIYGSALQMQSELQWFKEVESVVPPSARVAKGVDFLTPEEKFRVEHAGLMEEGEKWIKETASSCSVVGALVVTIMFAAAFTIPGGNNQESGYPIFLKQRFFKLFIFSTILSLFSSSTSVLMFLGVLTSRYSEEDFLKSLPTKLIIGLSTLIISIATMIIAFLATIRLMLQHSNYSWGLLPVIILASVPVYLFVLLQFPLLLNTTFYTYAGIFDRNVEPWP